MIFLTVTSIFHCTQKNRKKISYALKEEESSKALKVVAPGRRGSPELLILLKRGFKEEGESREFRRLQAYVGAYLICTEKKQKENLFLSDTKSNCWQRSLHRLKEHVLRILHQAGHREREREDFVFFFSKSCFRCVPGQLNLDQNVFQ